MKLKHENPGVLILLLVLILSEITLILLYERKHFREFTDAVLILTFVVAGYFIYQYLQARKNIPIRGCQIATDL
jgi:Mn2+/Fe2+ NRAMP family transporter